MSSEQGLICMCRVVFDYKYDNLLRYGETMEFAIWADEGSPASEACITRPPILIEHLKDTCDLTHYWLSDCGLHHVDCFVAEETLLPTRVLEVSGSLEAPLVKLMETNGMKGHYCTLNHCWGPPDKQPLTTTRANIQRHLIGIPLEQLPKSFRDTVMLARGIGIKFVWVDSLCIIQGDSQDWHSEAKEMGKIYSNATLVIAAAGSRDSSEGLFITERPQPVSVGLPYISDGVVKDSFNMALLPQHEDRPARGPLNERAWAFQEWYLARRLLFFMPGGITWKCNELRLSERGNHNDLELYEDESWLWLLKSYSEKKLTYHDDRLVALRGIIAEMQKTRQDQFLFEYGVWEDHILEQILWRRVKLDSEVNLLKVPTWSWAANGDSKIWCLNHYQAVVRYMPKLFELTSSGSLSMAGNMLRLTWKLRHFSSWRFQRKEDTPFESSMFPGFADNGGETAYLIWDDASDEIIMGIAVFDRGPISNARYFPIASTERDSDQSCHLEDSLDYSQRSEPSESDEEPNISDHDDESYDSDSETHLSNTKCGTSSNDFETSQEVDIVDHNEDSERVNMNDFSDSEYGEGIETSQVWNSVNNEENSQMQAVDDLDSQHDSDMSEDSYMDDDWIISRLDYLVKTTSHVYWALVLEPLGKAKFKRVGLAMLYPHAYEVSSKEFTEFELV